MNLYSLKADGADFTGIDVNGNNMVLPSNELLKATGTPSGK